MAERRKTKPPKPKMGRPPLADPATTPLNLKVTLAFRRAAETYGAKHGIDGLGPAVKAAAERVYRAEGLL